MTVKVLVTALGQQIIADTKQIENKETNELVGYWMSNPRVIAYNQNEEGEISVNFGTYCLVSDEAAFSIRSEHIVAILEPRAVVVEGYSKFITPDEEDGTDVVATEEPAGDASVTDGAAGDGTEGSYEEAAPSVGEDEAVPAEVA